MNNSYTSFELLPNVRIYQGLLPDVEKLYETMRISEKTSQGKYYLRPWDKWAHFGTYSQQKHEENESREFGQMYDDEKYLSDRVYEAYNLAIQNYIDTYNITLPETSKLIYI